METRVVLCAVPELDINHNHTYDFNSKQEQLDFFNSKSRLTFDDVMYQKDNDSIKLDIPYGDRRLMSCNYLYYINPGDSVIHYCFIVSKKYINENTTQLFLKLDVMQTYLVGIDYRLSDSFIERQHMNPVRTNGRPNLDILNIPEDIECGEYEIWGHYNIYDFEDKGGYIVASTDKLSKKGENSGAGDTPSPGGGTTPTPTPTPSVTGDMIVASARKLIGMPYILGGKVAPLGNNSGTDCSGLCQWAYNDNGITIPRVTYDQVQQGKEVRSDELQPGDLIFMNWSEAGPEHVIMFAHYNEGGGFTAIEARDERYPIGEFTWCWENNFMAKRYLTASSGSSASSNLGSLDPNMDRWDILIKQKAVKYDVEPAIIKAIMYQESGGDPNAVSRVGAAGLMQLMPGTAQEVAGKLGWSSYDVYNPDQNVEMGTFYFTDLTKTYDLQGPTLQATYANTLAAYNWGIGNYLSSGQRHNVENGNYSNLPTETQKYINNILSTYNLIK